MIIRQQNRRKNIWHVRGHLESLEGRTLLAGDLVSLVADNYAVVQNAAAQPLSVLANDEFEPEYAGARELTSVSYGSAGGRLQISEDRQSILYWAPADFSGTEQFTYYVDGEYAAGVQVQVTSPLRDDHYLFHQDQQDHELRVLANDPFWNGYQGPRLITLTSVTSGLGEVRITDDQQHVIYTPDPYATGQEEFVYIVDNVYSARVVIDLPSALENDEFELLQNAPESALNVLANDPFWNNYTGNRIVTHVTESLQQSGAVIQPSADGRSVLYTPAEDFFGYDSFQYVIDGRFEATVSVDVNRPTRNDSFEVDLDSTGQRLDVLANDAYWSRKQNREIDVVNRVTSASNSAEGGTVTLTADGSAVLYTPPAGFEGPDQFQYVADERYPATVNVYVTRPVRDDYLTVYQDTPNQNLSVKQNDFLGNGYTGARAITNVSATDEGAAVSYNSERVFYTPPTGFVGSDRFTYEIDGSLAANVTVGVMPLAQHDSYYFCTSVDQTYSLSVLSNDYFNRGYQGPRVITSAEITDGSGTVSISSDGSRLLYSPGSRTWDRLTYVVDDKYPAQVSVSRTNHLTSDRLIVNQNDAPATFPVMANDFIYRAHDCDPANYSGSRRITSVSQTSQGGTVSIAADGKSLEYQPAADFYGTDTFQYVVDGVMEATATVVVVRRVNDDVVRAAADATESIDVLANDVFGADYSGAQTITAIGESAQGAVIEIAEQGKSLRYTAPAGFSGVDTFVYTVDNQLKASVEVHVQADGSQRFPQFESASEFETFLLDDALQRYEGLFGTRYYDSPWWWADGDVVDYAAAGPEGVRDHSETNVQVEGIDEADIVEFDSDYVYTLTGNDVVILDAWPAEALAEVSRYRISGEAEGMYLNGDRLTIVSQLVTWPEFPPAPVVDTVDGIVGAPLGDWFYPIQPASYETIVTVLDVGDRTAPALIQKTTVEGRYVQSRAVDDFVYVAVTNEAIPPAPIVIPDEPVNEDDPTRSGTYETQDQYLARVRENLGIFIDDTLPNYSSTDATGAVLRHGLLHEPEDIYRPLTAGASNLVSLIALNVQNVTPGLASTTGVYTNGATTVYASLEHFYIFEDDWDEEQGTVTRILQFDWDHEQGGTGFSSSGYVPGRMLNQFSADEYEGYLRVVTTIGHQNSGNWSSVSENDLFVLRDDGGFLEFTSSLQNVALNEAVQSVRFMGTRALMVTFQTVDPLFGLDLSDPERPTTVGHLTLPGFSSYMQFITSDRLLTVGQNTPNGVRGPTQVSLYDVQDLSHPQLIDQYTFERFSTSEAQADHHAFGYFAQHGLFAVPTRRTYPVRVDADDDGYRESTQWITEDELSVFRIDTESPAGTNDGIELLANLSHDSAVRRSGYIGDYLFSVADNSVHVASISDPTAILATASDLAPTPDDGEPAAAPDLAEFDHVVALAQQDVAARFSVAPGAAIPVTTETRTNGWQTVLRLDDTYLRYASDGTRIELTEVNYHFPQSSESLAWQNAEQPLDVNRDGEIDPGDAIQLINRLGGALRETLPQQQVVREISQSGLPSYGWDPNGDGLISVTDVLLIMDHLNANSQLSVPLGELDPDRPETLLDPASVEAYFERVYQTAGDANLDGRFDSSDLVKIFQHGKYEDGIPKNSSWGEGDWNGDGDFTSRDLVLAFTYGRYSAN